jgi:nucleolar GTP-binding protein
MLLFSRAATTTLKPISPPRRFGTVVVASSRSSSSFSFVGARSSVARVFEQQQQRRKKKRCCCCCSGRSCRSFVVASGNRDEDDDNDGRKQSFAENEDSGKIGTKGRARTGILNRVPNVAQSKDILLSGLKRSQRITHTSGLRVPLLKERNKSAKQLDGLTTALCKPLGEYVKGFPKIERLHPFERALLELTVDPEVYAKTIAEVDQARKSMLTMGKEYSSRAKNGKTEKETKAVREEGFKNMEARFVKSQAKFEKLKEMAKKLRRLPVAELETPTVAMVGAPNVGKSSLVRSVSSGVPEVNNYPFTTRGVVMGHFFIEDRRHVVTDTPGLIFRVDEERNKIEKLAIATLEHLPVCAVFVTDLSGLSGTSVEDQLALREELRERFASRRPWLDVLSKCELVPALGGKMDESLESTWTEEDTKNTEAAAKMLKENGAMVTSVADGVGIAELKAALENEQLYDSILELKRSKFRADNDDEDDGEERS